MVMKVDLDEKEHAMSILQRLDRMKQDQQHCDFIVSVDGNEFHAHRNILSAGSDYFRAMLIHDTKESQLGKVEMIGADSECVEICLNYIYTGKAEVPKGKTEQLIGTAALMQLHKLINAVLQLLIKSLDASSFYSTRKIAEMYDLQGLLAACRTFEQENILSVSSQDDFQREQKVDIVDILTSVPLSDQEKLIVSLRWVGEFAERKSNLIDFLKFVNLEEVPEDYLDHILQSNSLIKADFELYKIFSVPLMRKLKAGSINRNDSYVVRSFILFDGSSGSLLHLNPKTDNIETFHEKFNEFKEFSAVALHSYIYILSKNRSVHRLSFQDMNSKWEKIQDMIECHGDYPPSVPLNGFLYVIGGHYDPVTSAAEKFCPSENRWVRLKDKPVATKGAVLVTLGESIFSLGGESNEAPSNAFHKFNPQFAKWTELEPMQQAKSSCGATAVNQKIYVFGGEDDNYVFRDMECYDVTLNQWTRLAPMIASHFLIKAHHVSGSIFAVQRFADSDTIEKYNIIKDEWQIVELNGTEKFEIYDSVLI